MDEQVQPTEQLPQEEVAPVVEETPAEAPAEEPVAEVVPSIDPMLNCPTCLGSGLQDERTLCPNCLGKGKVS